MSTRRPKFAHWFILTIVCFFFVASITPVFAQGSTFIPIAVGDNKTGTLSSANPVSRFALAVTSAQGISIRTFAITPGFAPGLALLNTEGVVIASNNNPTTATAIELTTNTLNIGAYIIEVSSVNGQLGDFLLNVEGVEVEPPVALPVGQIVTNSVSSGTPRRAYAFAASPASATILVLQSQLPNSGSNFLLTDANTGETIASSSPRLRGGRYLIPSGTQNYIAEISFAGAPIPEGFQLCIAPETNPTLCAIGSTGAPPPTPIVATDIPAPTLPPTQLPPLPISSVCILASATGSFVNIRSGPSTSFPVVGQLNSTSIANVIARLPDNSWQQVNVNGLTGWMSTSVVRFGGPCQTVPFVTLTPTPTFTITPTPTATGTLTTPTSTATLTPTAGPTLNFSLPPVFGSTSLTAGFLPDPFTVGVTAGGPAYASYLGAGCTGYMTSAPSFSVNYVSGAAANLQFYFIGGGDTTMVINSPSGSYFCNDDSFSTFSPTITFNSPSSGRYDVWVGTYASGGSIGGTLYVTEITGNHP